MKLEFVRAVVVDGSQFKIGDVVEAGGERADYFASCLRMGHAVKVDSTAGNETNNRPAKAGK